MKVKLIKTEITGEKRISETFESKYGRFCGFLEADERSTGKNYDVELDITSVLTFNEVTPAAENVTSICGDIKNTSVCALAEEYDGELLYLRIGGDIVMVMTDNDPEFKKFEGKFIQFNTSNIKLYDNGFEQDELRTDIYPDEI